MGLFEILFGKKPDTKTEVVEEITPKTEVSLIEENGYSFNNERIRELNKVRSHLLTEYDYIDSVKATKNRVIRLTDTFPDSKELIVFFGLKAENCVIVLETKGKGDFNLNVTPIIHKDIAGVFATHEKGKYVYFPDGIGINIVLYNVVPVNKNDRKIYVEPKHFELFDLPTKNKLIKVIFGESQKLENKVIENFLLSTEVVRQDSLYFYLMNKASKEVKEKIFAFKDRFLEIKNKSMFTDKVFPRVPDEVSGGYFDWDQAEKNAKDGVDVAKFYGHIFYEILSNDIPELRDIMNKEYERIRFVELFPTLEKQLTRQGTMNGFGQLGKYAYVPIDRARYDYYTSISLRVSTDRNHCFWDDLLRDLESLYKGEKQEKYCGSVKESEKKKVEKANKNFHAIAEEMISGKASNDDEVISYINFNSEKDIKKQIERATTFSFIKLPIVDSQNYQTKELIDKLIIDSLESLLNEELEKGFIASNAYKVI